LSLKTSIPDVLKQEEFKTTMPRLLWVGPFIDQWRVTDDADDSKPHGIFEGRDVALAWACRQALQQAPCLVRLLDDEGSITAQFAFEHPPMMEAA
jgi:hypothetical protein